LTEQQCFATHAYATTQEEQELGGKSRPSLQKLLSAKNLISGPMFPRWGREFGTIAVIQVVFKPEVWHPESLPRPKEQVLAYSLCMIMHTCETRKYGYQGVAIKLEIHAPRQHQVLLEGPLGEEKAGAYRSAADMHGSVR